MDWGAEKNANPNLENEYRYQISPQEREILRGRNLDLLRLLHLFPKASSPDPRGKTMPAQEHLLDPDSLSAKERQALREQIGHLRSASSTEGPAEKERKLALEVGDGETVTIELPEAVGDALLGALFDLAEGRPVSVADADEELTTREAAELLNVSRPHLVKLLKEGEIPSHKVGSHHRVRRRDVLAYKKEQRTRSEEAMQRLTEESQKLGLGY